ncbi:MAG: bifunctional DNA-formamidopyrimidine glycosylase/DNA-(apurinic or apyrimidinic site) lyase [Actinomycetes bacterium]
MPELPEVETVRRGLEEKFIGRRIDKVEVGRQRSVRRTSREEVIARLTGVTAIAAHRRGKYLLCPLDSGDVMMIHLRMSGRVLIDGVDSPRPAHSHVVLTLRDISGSIQELRFVDPRTFGEVVVFDPADADSIVPELARLGLDPITDGLSLAQLRKILRTTVRPIKAALLDQHLVAGIGNIYGDEILHQARVNPLRPARDVGPAQSVRIHRAIHEILEAAISQGGSTLGDSQYVDLEGESGSFQNQHRVYGRAGELCLSCHRGKIFSANIGGRTSCWCRVCQR